MHFELSIAPGIKDKGREVPAAGPANPPGAPEVPAAGPANPPGAPVVPAAGPANPTGAPVVPAAGPASPRAGESDLEYLQVLIYSKCLYTVNSSIIETRSCT